MIMKVLIVKERKKVFINFNTTQRNTTQHNTTQHADYVGQRLFVKQFNPFLSVFYMLKNGFFNLHRLVVEF